jgi:hypothetical protein
MKYFRKVSVKFLLALALVATPLVAFQLQGTDALAQSSYFASRGCTGCHSTPVATSCAGCHQHSGTLAAAKNKTTAYAPGETVTITLTASGARSGWIGVRLYDQDGSEIARGTGNQSGMGGSATYPATLSAPAPAAAGSYTWRIAYLGNENGTGSGDTHSEKSVTVAFTVAALTDSAAPIVTFVLPATSTTLTVPVSTLTASDNVGVTGYLITTTSNTPAASAAGWTATAPASVTMVGNSIVFYAWAKDAAGNVSAVKSATVTLSTAADTTKPTLVISTLDNGSSTNIATLNVSGNATDTGGIASVTVNGQTVTVNQDGSFSYAVTLTAGANTVTTVATDNAGNQQSDVRTVTYDASAPVLTVSAPADNSTTTQSFMSVTGTISESSTVTVSVNNGSPQTAAISGGTFSATVNLTPGINTIDITAVDPAGNSATAKRTVTFTGTATSLTLAVTNPNQDITTKDSSITIRGTVADATGDVTILITMNGKTYTPEFDDGAFKQRLVFTTARLYAITVTATDEVGASSSIVRNVIYSPSNDHNDDDKNDNDDDHHDKDRHDKDRRNDRNND